MIDYLLYLTGVAFLIMACYCLYLFFENTSEKHVEEESKRVRSFIDEIKTGNCKAPLGPLPKDVIGEEPPMTVREFAVEVSKHEGNKKQVNIAQISEVLKVVNKLTGGKLYKIIRGL